MKVFAWALPVALAVSAIAYSTALYNIEDAKQNSFMMKACVDAGGGWRYSWGKGVCERPQQR